ncbi:phage tail tape measure protein [Paenibacillus sp. Marseille-Q4541]|uniref:phage tail tape measure protein n=1 Tax=Paenibacillus sp. Marseille-Q4541 TaxID=2831522 RepID=UPI001BAA81DF|nr:phage tail tape measure protein [Paenibacillus sp. Marseille-Q4541]
MDKLQILISAGINTSESIGNINAALKALSRHPSLQKLDVKINVDESFVKSISNFIESTKKLNVALETQNKVTQETINEYRKLDGTVEKVTQQILKSGEIINKTKVIHDENKNKLAEESAAYNNQSASVERLEKDLKNLSLAQEKVKKNKYGEITGTNSTYKSDDGTQKVTANYNKDGLLNSYSISEDYEKLLRDEEQFIDQMYQQRLKAESNTRNFYNNWEKAQQEHISKNADLNRKDIQNEKQLELDRDKQHYIALQQNRKRQQEYEKAIKEAEIRLASARKQYRNNSTSANSIDGLTNELSQITSVGNYKKAISDVNTKLKEITTTSKKAELQVNALGQQFASAASKIALWGGISTAIFLPIQGLQNAVQTIVEVNTQMTQLQRVMSDNTNFDSMLESSIELANEYGRSIKDVNENLIGFARMGFSEIDTTALAETTTLLQNISDLTPEESVDTLTAAMTVFNIEADKSIEIADKLNEVNLSASLCDNTHVKSLLIDLEFRLVG